MRFAVILTIDSEYGQGVFLGYVEGFELLGLTVRGQQAVNINGVSLVAEVEVTIDAINDIRNNTGEDTSIFGILEREELSDGLCTQVGSRRTLFYDGVGTSCSKFGS